MKGTPFPPARRPGERPAGCAAGRPGSRHADASRADISATARGSTRWTQNRRPAVADLRRQVQRGPIVVLHDQYPAGHGRSFRSHGRRNRQVGTMFLTARNKPPRSRSAARHEGPIRRWCIAGDKVLQRIAPSRRWACKRTMMVQYDRLAAPHPDDLPALSQPPPGFAALAESFAPAPTMSAFWPATRSAPGPACRPTTAPIRRACTERSPRAPRARRCSAALVRRPSPPIGPT